MAWSECRSKDTQWLLISSIYQAATNSERFAPNSTRTLRAVYSSSTQIIETRSLLCRPGKLRWDRMDSTSLDSESSSVPIELTLSQEKCHLRRPRSSPRSEGINCSKHPPCQARTYRKPLSGYSTQLWIVWSRTGSGLVCPLKFEERWRIHLISNNRFFLHSFKNDCNRCELRL